MRHLLLGRHSLPTGWGVEMNGRAGDLLRRDPKGFLAWVDTRLERDPALQDVSWELFWEGILGDPNRCPEYPQ